MVDQGLGSLMAAIGFGVWHFIMVFGAYTMAGWHLSLSVLWVFLCSLSAVIALFVVEVNANQNYAAIALGFLVAYMLMGLEYLMRSILVAIGVIASSTSVAADGAEYGLLKQVEDVVGADSKKEWFLHSTKLKGTLDHLVTRLWRPMMLMSFMNWFFVYYGLHSSPVMVVAHYNQTVPVYPFSTTQLVAIPIIHTIAVWVLFGLCASILLSYVMPPDGVAKDAAYFLTMIFFGMVVQFLLTVTIVMYSSVGERFVVGVAPSLIGWGFLTSAAYNLFLMGFGWLFNAWYNKTGTTCEFKTWKFQPFSTTLMPNPNNIK